MLTLDKIVSEKTAAIEEYLWEISSVIKTKAFDDKLLNECVDHIKHQYFASSAYYFQQSFF